ncbi:hypothetical protein CEXT_510021 [Caerostris extrusa]|uniref:Uncharacterized protein n=1 Tax=Caerostris extrusa TaxID=172846 RepID=A0AAV4UY41_CAEEX|nr:hypothetical protein CEXT_510021 [Caerostris extrusa]
MCPWQMQFSDISAKCDHRATHPSGYHRSNLKRTMHINDRNYKSQDRCGTVIAVSAICYVETMTKGFFSLVMSYKKFEDGLFTCHTITKTCTINSPMQKLFDKEVWNAEAYAKYSGQVVLACFDPDTFSLRRVSLLRSLQTGIIRFPDLECKRSFS